jgi:DNA-binding NarL/FixJ family response regulator
MTAARQPAPIRAVICDDVQEMRELIREVLEESGLQVVGEADNGSDAARLVAALEPDAIVLDLSMPGMDGLQAIPLIRAWSPRTAIVVFSGFAADRMDGVALKLGAHRYVEKGAHLGALADLLQEVVTEHRHDGRDGVGSAVPHTRGSGSGSGSGSGISA